jgi:SRSO17 transposase
LLSNDETTPPYETPFLPEALSVTFRRCVTSASSIEDTVVPKKGEHSVGVAAQYALALGKRQIAKRWCRCRSSGEVPVMIALRLFPPESRTNDAARLKRAGLPLE